MEANWRIKSELIDPERSLTWGETASKEHVEEVLGGDVGLEASVEVKTSCVRVTGAAHLFPSR